MMGVHMHLLLYLRLTSVAVTCWSYSVSNKTMDWFKANTWCIEKYTGLMVIQNKEQHDYLRLNLKEEKYWIGLRKTSGEWMWQGTLKPIESNESWADNEPNNIKDNEDCVEMYIRPKRPQTNGKWNDEKCDGQRYALCYTAHCKPNPCVNGAECQETINSYNCTFTAPCKPLSVFGGGKVNCSKDNGPFCTVECLPGHLLLGPREYSCQPDGSWSPFQPLCASHDHLLMALTMFSILSAVCYCMFCCSYCTKRKKAVTRSQEVMRNLAYEGGDEALLEDPLRSV